MSTISKDDVLQWVKDADLSELDSLISFVEKEIYERMRQDQDWYSRYVKLAKAGLALGVRYPMTPIAAGGVRTPERLDRELKTITDICQGTS